jgi:hypothetical protein
MKIKENIKIETCGNEKAFVPNSHRNKNNKILTKKSLYLNFVV